MGLFDGTPLERPITCEQCGDDMGACVCPPPLEPQIEPSQQRLQVRLEKRKRGKTVTVISGFSCSASQLKKSLTDLKNLCGAGGTIDGQQIELQGDHVERLQRELPELGYQLHSPRH